ncbi:unnamed protein product [Cunninghamella blakesleeana]
MDIQNIPFEHHHNSQYSEPTSLHYSHQSRPSPSISLTSTTEKHTLPTIPEYSSPPNTTTINNDNNTMMDEQDLLLPPNNANLAINTTTDDVLSSSNIHPALMLGRFDKRKSSPAILGLPFDITNDISSPSSNTSSQLDLHLTRHRNSIEAAMLLANFNRVPTVTKETQESDNPSLNTNNNMSHHHHAHTPTNINLKGANSWQDDLNIASQTQTKSSISGSLRRHSYDVNMNWKSMPQEFRERSDLIDNSFSNINTTASSSSAFKPVIKQESLYNDNDLNQIPNRITWTQDGLYQTDTSSSSSHYNTTNTNTNTTNNNIYGLGPHQTSSQHHPHHPQQQPSQHDLLHPLASTSLSNSNDMIGQKREFTYYPQQPSYYYHPPSSSATSSAASSPHHLPLTQHMYSSSSTSPSSSLGKLPLPSSSSSSSLPYPTSSHHPHPLSQNNPNPNNNIYMQSSSSSSHPHPHSLPHPHPLSQLSSHHPHAHPPPHHPHAHPHPNDYYGHPNHPGNLMVGHPPPLPPPSQPQKPKRKRVQKETEEVVEAGDADFPDMCPRDVELAKTDPDARPRRQKLRFEGDMYTPKWVRFNGQAKEGLCDTCQPGRWLQLKNSAYWYHKQFYHGISSVSGAEFVQPIETRWVDQDLVEGLCHQCHQWVAVSNVKRKNSVLWFRHAHKCHVYHKPKNAPLRR